MITLKHFYLLAVLFLMIDAFVCPHSLICAGLLTYSFDDGFMNTYENAMPILESHGQVGTAGVITDFVLGSGSERMHAVHLLELESKGWEICSHSMTHNNFDQIPQTYDNEILLNWQRVSGMDNTFQCKYDYGQLTFMLQNGNRLIKKKSVIEVEACPGSYYFDSGGGWVYVNVLDGDSPLSYEMRSGSVERELEQSRLILTDLGLHVKNFIVPGSRWNDTRASLSEKYYESSASGPEGAPHGTWWNPIPATYPWWLSRKPVNADTTVAEVTAWITEHVINGDEWVILIFHSIGENIGWQPWTSEKLEELASWVESNNVEVVTQKEGVIAGSVPVPQSSWLFSAIIVMAIFLQLDNKKSNKTIGIT